MRVRAQRRQVAEHLADGRHAPHDRTGLRHRGIEDHGATLLQLYTSIVYRGIGVVSEIKADLAAAIKRGYRNSLASMIGNDAATITAESWPG